ncbi:biotin transporter BioY [Orenia marismortui]|uniref:Biotin transporter n=1 Tax=Orenia marismortui TaxID=46469 RepID=A0A4R8H022_9FIRM|nr:biotin transporter BioY [Orenia marismortui]TDX47833.1 biotin transport system substrate-specific component [Orenia marismortui]
MKTNTKSMVLVALFAALTAIGAFIKIPTPFGVPFSLQPLFVIFAANLLGARLALLSQLVYIFIGLIGIPIFTQGGGPSYVLQPTFGYLIGFAIGAYVIGKLIEAKEKNFKNFILANLAGLVVFYLFGVAHLYLVLNFYLGKTYPINQALVGGFLIFLPFDIIKAIISALISKEVINRIEDAVPITKSKN